MSQRAREAAWKHRPECYFEYHKDDWMKGVYDETRIIQAFARIEAAATERAARICDEVAEGLRTTSIAAQCAKRIRETLP